MRDFLRLILFVIVVGLPAFALRLPLLDRLGTTPVVLIVGDFRPEAFGALVRVGVDSAIRWEAERLPFKVDYIHFAESAASDGSRGPAGYAEYEATLKRFRQDLLAQFSTKNVVAVISANSSNSAGAVIEAAAAFHVPTLLTVATNDQLLDAASTTVFRLVPRDSLQAITIRDWSRQRSLDAGDLVGVAYDPGQYGIDLVSSIRTAVGNVRVLAFSLGTTTETTGILSYAKDLGVSSWVVIGYEHQALEFFAKKHALKVPGAMLMGDGAYGPWLADVADTAVYISFPASNHPTDSLLTRMPGFSSFGHDAVRLIAGAITSSSGAKISRRELPDAIRAAASDLSVKGILCHRYEFTGSGENRYGTFSILPAHSVRLSRSEHQ